MSTAVLLHAFAYGEHVESITQRSLGFRLLAPAEPQAWSAEVEGLARRLQTAPYPEHWPPTDLFCSLLLADGQRLIAVARYGLVDHTPSHRRGGLELIGILCPGTLSVKDALTVYHWLKKRRAEAEDLHALGGKITLDEVLTQVAPEPPAHASDPVPVLPIRLWQEGVLLFAATAPSDPDHRLSLLEQNAKDRWQWLPLAGADFPWPTYAQRGPIIAWTPHLAGVALKLDRQSTDEPLRQPPPRKRLLSAPLLIALLLILLLAGNLGAMLWLGSRIQPATPSQPVVTTPQERPPAAVNDDSRERFAVALHALLNEQGSRREGSQTEKQLLANYERALQKHKDLQLGKNNKEGKLAVGMAVVLSQRSAESVEEMVRQALTDKFDPRLVKLACQFVHEQLRADGARER